ncbi:MAG: methyltransferase domain-containing protein [Myxococcales bacterium]|nr:methyltransferase domain-containing protein [Myxococcales bacterium]
MSCSIECSVAGLGEGRVLNLSVGGAYLVFAGTSQVPAGSLALRFVLDDVSEPITIHTAIVRSSPIAAHAGGGLGCGVRFESPNDETTRRLHAFVLGKLLTEIAEIMEAEPEPVEPGNIELVTGAPEVASKLKTILAADVEVPGVLFQRDVAELIDVTLSSVMRERITIQLRRSGSRWPVVGGHVHLNLNRGFSHIHAHTQVLDRSGSVVTLEVPPSLTIFQLRGAPRRQAEPGQMFVEVPLPYPPGHKLKREILDISSTGLAFKIRPDEAYFLPGTPLREIVISGSDDDRAYHKAAQVMHVTPVKEESGRVTYLKVGVAFGIADEGVKRGVKPNAASLKKSTSFLSRMTGLLGQIAMRRGNGRQRSYAAAAPKVEIVRFPNARREELVGILNTTPRDPNKRLRAPLVIIPPAHGKRKESTSGLALTLVENFARRRRDVVVLRFDGIRNIGESYKDPECREPGNEALHMTLSQGVDDIAAALEWAHDNSIFTPTEIILVSFSLQGVMGRRAVYRDGGRQIHYWIGVTGAPAAQEIIRNASGGVDYIAQYASGKRIGRGSVLGIEIEGERFCEDLLREGLAFMADAKREIAEIPIPVTWILGQYDAWIDPSTIREFMNVPASGERELVELECGHIPLNSEEALRLFSVVVRSIWRFLHDEEIEVTFPDVREFVTTRKAEWRRIPKSPIPDKRRYWQEYLLGGTDRRISYDVLNAAEEYVEFLDREAELLGVKPHHRVADMGCGTGNFSARLARRRGGRSRPACQKLTLVDFVDEALVTAQGKLEALGRDQRVALPELAVYSLNLELSPLRTVRAFLAGEFYGYDPLKGAIKGLSDYSIDMWKSVDDWRLHDILRGRELDKEDLDFLRGSFPEDEQEVIAEMNRLTRFLRGRWRREDFNREGRQLLDRDQRPAAAHLKLDRMSVHTGDARERLPFEDASFDRIVCSLVLSYLSNPVEVLREFYRCLEPGGRLVVSSMRPDVDMSRIYRNLMIKLESGARVAIPAGMDRATFVEEVQHYLNSAAFLLKLAEEGQFVFFSRGEMRRIVERAGFRRVETFTSFGKPPQALITVGYR